MSPRVEGPALPRREDWGTRLEARHRVLVAGLMLAATAVGLLLPEPDRPTQLVVLAIGVVLLALPHGAVDPWLAIRRSASRSARLRFAGLYLALAALAVAAWIAAPTASLAVFLGVSAWHFGQGELDARRPTILWRWVESLTAGATPILAPLLFRPQETLDLLGLLCGRDLSSLPSTGAWPAVMTGWTVCRLVSWIDRLRVARRTGDGIALAIVAGQVGCMASFAALPVLLAFGLYFCADHSVRHALRVAVRFAPGSRRDGIRRFVSRSLPFTFATLVLAVVVGSFGLGGFGETELVRLVFVGLAALTLPHVTIGLPVRPLDTAG